MTVSELYVLFGLQVDSASWAKGNQLIRGLANAAREALREQLSAGLETWLSWCGERAAN